MSELTAEEVNLLPSDEDIAFYQDNGYYISKKIFSDEEIDAALRGSERFYAGDVDEPDIELPDSFRPGGDYEGLRKHDYASFFNRELARLSRSPLIGAIAARLTGSDGIRLWHDQLLYKPVDEPGKKANVGWHTDRTYWKCCTSSNMLTAWIPFHDCDEAMGTITFIEGSHRWPDNTEGLDFFNPNLEELEKRFGTGTRPVVRVPAKLGKGQVSFHHCLTIHGSGPNRGDAPRRSIAVHLQDSDNRFQGDEELRKSGGKLLVHQNESLCRKVGGVPDFTDPAVFPTLFAAGS